MWGAAVAVVVVTLALLGHAWGMEPALLAVAADAVHQFAVIAWVGGLVALVTVGPVDRTGELVRRFSRVALHALAVVVVTGLASAAWQTAADPSTLTTSYAALLIAKTGLVAVMVALGWWQRRRLATATQSAQRLLVGVRAEVVVAVIVLAVTAVLTSTVPARASLEPGPFTTVVEEDLGAVAVTVQPALVGENVLTMAFSDRVGSPRAVDVARLTVQQGGLPPRDVTLTALAPDRWAAIDVSLPAATDGTFEVTTLARGQVTTTSFTVPIRTGGG